MLYVPVSQLRPGMLLGCDLPSDYYGLALVAVGQELTKKTIARIQELGIAGAYIKTAVCADIDLNVEAVLSSVIQKRLVEGVKKQFDRYSAQPVVSNELLEGFYNMSSDIVTSVINKEHVMLNLVNIKRYDDYTYSHSVMVGLISTLIGTKLGLKQADLQCLATAGLMHDIGKTDVPLEIVNKPARLTDEEFEVMKKHPAYAVEKLRKNHTFNLIVLRGIECHHERFDGSGYPNGLCGENIPLYGRILALADVYDALTSKRSYRDSWTSHQTIEYMMSQANSHFDLNLLNLFLMVTAAYPVGSVVRLSNGYTGVVTANTPGMTLRPTVRVIQPMGAAGINMDLANDIKYLNITISETLDSFASLDADLFKA